MKAHPATAQGPDAAPPTEGPAKDAKDSAPIELAFIVPVLVMVVAGAIQFGAIFFLRDNMAKAAEEAAHALAVGSIETVAQTVELVEDNLVNWGVTFSVKATLPNPGDPARDKATVVITAPLAEAAIFDFLGVFKGGTLRAAASTPLES